MQWWCRVSRWTPVSLPGMLVLTTCSFLATGPVAPYAAAAAPSGGGYWLVAADGGVFSYDAPFYGSTGGTHLNRPIVGMASTPDGRGYWELASDGGIFAYGDAGFYGSAGSLRLNASIVGMASTRDGGGYWLVASDGGIFAYGDAGFYGSTGGTHLNRPIVGMAATPDGRGYWLVASDGGIFAYGDAGFYGSAGSLRLDASVVGMAATPDGGGYWLVASDGGIFAYGDAGFYGSTGGTRLNRPIVGMAATPDGRGYWLVASDGGIFAYGDANFYGSTGGTHLNQPVVSMAESLLSGPWSPARVVTDGPAWSGSGLEGTPYTAMSCQVRWTAYQGQSQPLPDPNCTPGGIDSQIGVAQICSSSWSTSLVRPPVSVTEPAKFQAISAYQNYDGTSATPYEFDHLVPLELGGNSDTANLWVEANIGGTSSFVLNAKDQVENDLHAAVCNGLVTLAAAQLAIASNWTTAEATLGLAPGSGGGQLTPYCTASAASANDGFSGDYDVSINSNQPNQRATASDSTDSYSASTDASGSVTIRLYFTSPGEQISVVVGPARCSTTA
jgi:hypothetical protein